MRDYMAQRETPKTIIEALNRMLNIIDEEGEASIELLTVVQKFFGIFIKVKPPLMLQVVDLC